MPKTMVYNTNVTFGGELLPFSSVSYQKTQEMVDTTTTDDNGWKSVTPGLKERNASVTVYKGTTGLTIPEIGDRGTFSWTGGESFPARVADVSYGQAQINGAVPVTIKFEGDGND